MYVLMMLLTNRSRSPLTKAHPQIIVDESALLGDDEDKRANCNPG
jgi:hypothetical protein